MATLARALARALPRASAAQRGHLAGCVFEASGVLGRSVPPLERKAQLEAIKRSALELAAEVLLPMSAPLWRHYVADHPGNPVRDAHALWFELQQLAAAAQKAIDGISVRRNRPRGGDALQLTVKLVLGWRYVFGELPAASRNGDFGRFHGAACDFLGVRRPVDPYRLFAKAIRIARSVQ